MKIKTFKYFYPEKPQLMTIDQDSFEEMSADTNWVAELKYDGRRCLVHILDGKVEFWGRHGKVLAYNNDPDADMVADLQKKFPKGYFIFDAELRDKKVKGVRDKLVIWDVFIFMDQVMNREQYWTRRAILENRIGDLDGNVQLIEQFPTDFQKVYDENIGSDEIEGLVMKNLHGKIDITRTSAKNSNWMYKVRKPSGRYKF